MQTPPAPITSLNNNSSIENDVNSRQLNSQINADMGGKKDLTIPTKPTAFESNVEKPDNLSSPKDELSSPKKAVVETSTPPTIKPPKPDHKTALPSAESMEVEPTQSSSKNDPDNVSLERNILICKVWG